MKETLEPCRALPAVKDVRVMGAIGVIELNRHQRPQRDAGALHRRRAFIRPIGNVIYLTPAFTIAPEELKVLTDTIVRVVGALNG